MASLITLCAFIIYVVIGSVIMHYYEPDMTIFNGIYFNFVTLTTVGLGDVVPKRYKTREIQYIRCLQLFVSLGHNRLCNHRSCTDYDGDRDRF